MHGLCCSGDLATPPTGGCVPHSSAGRPPLSTPGAAHTTHTTHTHTHAHTPTQYPLRPAHLPYDSVESAKVSVEGCLSLEVGVRPRGTNYSTSRGEGFAKMVQLGVKGQDKVYQR